VPGDRPLSAVKPSDIQQWVKRLTGQLEPSTVGVVHGVVSGIFRAAMRDRVITHNPCDGTKLPKTTKSRVEPLATDVVLALAESVPDRYRALVILAAGSGMRQGECFGLTMDRIDFLRRIIQVDRQLVTVTGRPPFLAPPKTAASVRSIPLPTVVVDALAAHLAKYPPGADGLLFTTDAGHPIRRTSFGNVWRVAVRSAGAPHGTGFHELRHYYASLLIRHGGAGPARSRKRIRDARHLLPPVAGQRRSHPHGGRFCPSCGLCADWGGGRWTYSLVKC
jgi:integrase